MEPKALKPCATALAAAQAAQDAVAPDTVILFGSRARGDHCPDSDIDLLVIHQKHEALNAVHRAKTAARARIGADRPDPPAVQIPPSAGKTSSMPAGQKTTSPARLSATD